MDLRTFALEQLAMIPGLLVDTCADGTLHLQFFVPGVAPQAFAAGHAHAMYASLCSALRGVATPVGPFSTAGRDDGALFECWLRPLAPPADAAPDVVLEPDPAA